MNHRTCGVPDCATDMTGKYLRKGYCERHYYSWSKYGTPTPSVEQRRSFRKAREVSSKSYELECSGCGNGFVSASRIRKFCSEVCREKTKAERRALESGLTCYVCGEGMIRYKDSAPHGEAAHKACLPKVENPGPNDCPICGERFEPIRSRSAWTRTCSKPCAMRLAIREGTHNLQDGKQVGRDMAKVERNWRKRRALKMNAKSEPYTKEEIAERDNYICYLCDSLVDMKLVFPDPGFATVEHVVALSNGGDDTPDNVRLAHLTCNIRKGTKTLKEVRDGSEKVGSRA